MSKPKAVKAKGLYDRIQKSTRLTEIAVIKDQIDSDPEFNALDKMNLGGMISMRIRELSEGVLKDMEAEVSGRDAEPEAPTDPSKSEVSTLYTLFFSATSGHISLVKRDFEKYMDRVLAVLKLPEQYAVLLNEWAEYRYHGEKLTLQDGFYWTVDHMGILPGDIKRVQDQAEGAIRTYYKDDDLDWGYLDLIRRTLHAIELLEDNYNEIRAYVDQAQANAEIAKEVKE